MDTILTIAFAVMGIAFSVSLAISAFLYGKGLGAREERENAKARENMLTAGHNAERSEHKDILERLLTKAGAGKPYQPALSSVDPKEPGKRIVSASQVVSELQVKNNEHSVSTKPAASRVTPVPPSIKREFLAATQDEGKAAA